jgi:uncharacterized protein with HEPN domain
MDNKTRAQLEIVLGYCSRISDTLDRAGSQQEFLSDYDLQYSVAHSISQISETLTQVLHKHPEYTEQILEVVPYRDIRRMRDKIQHHYGSIDPDVVWGIAQLSVPQLKAEIESLISE